MDSATALELVNEAGRRVLALSEEEARGLQHDYLGTEHLLLGLLREEMSLAARALRSLGVTSEPVRKYIASIVDSSEQSALGRAPLTPRAKKVIELALREALARGDDHIGPEHILVGVVLSEGVGARILLEFGADTARVRKAIDDPGAERPAAPPGSLVGASARIAAAAALERGAAKARAEERPLDLGDLLLNLTEEWPEDLVARVLREVGVDVDRLSEAIDAARRP